MAQVVYCQTFSRVATDEERGTHGDIGDQDIRLPKQDQEFGPKQDQESLSAPSLDCLCKAGASSWSCSINPNRTRNLSLLLPWTVSARQASLPGQLVYPFTGPFCYSCFSVKSCSPVLLGPYEMEKFGPAAFQCA